MAKRKPGKKLAGFWEFPGGKVKENEAPEDSLRRELREEMNVEIEVGEYIGGNVHQYGDFAIRLLAYRARIARGKIELADHDEYRWLEAGGLKKIKMAPADIPLVQLLTESQ